MSRLPFKAFDAVTVPTSAVFDLEGMYEKHAVYVSHLINPTTMNIDVQGSPDGNLWITLLRIAPSSGPLYTNTLTCIARFIRLNLTQITSGDVTAWIASC